MLRSNIRHATTSSNPASAPIGTHAISPPSSTNASTTNTPSVTPDHSVRPPLVKLTSVAPIVPAPGMPPTKKAAALPIPCPISSRLESLRRRARASSTTPVFNVSMESSTDSVRAEINITPTSAGRTSSKDETFALTASTIEPEVSIGPITNLLPASWSRSRLKNASAK